MRDLKRILLINKINSTPFISEQSTADKINQSHLIKERMRRQKIEHEISTNKIREGYLFKRSKFLKEWRKRWVILTHDYMLTFTHEDCRELTEMILLTTIQGYKSYLSKENNMNENSFKISCVDSETYLNCQSMEEKWSWIVTLERLTKFRDHNLKNSDLLREIHGKGFESYDEYLQRGSKSSQSNSMGASQSATESEAERLYQQIKKQKQSLDLEKQEIQRKRMELQFEKDKVQRTMNQMSLEDGRLRSRTVEQEGGNSQNIGGNLSQASSQNVSVKERLLLNIFEELDNKNNFWGFKHYLLFLQKILPSKKLNFQDSFLKLVLIEGPRNIFLSALIGAFCDSRKPQELKNNLQFMIFLYTNVGKWLFDVQQLEKIQQKILFELKTMGQKIKETESAEMVFFLLKMFEFVLERQKTELQKEEINFLLDRLNMVKVNKSNSEELKQVAKNMEVNLGDMKKGVRRGTTYPVQFK